MRILQSTLSWIATVAGFLVGMVGLAFFASNSILADYEISRDTWLLIVLLAILSVSALAGGVASFFSRRLAGWIYVSGGSLVALCGAFSGTSELTIISAMACAALILPGVFWFWTAKAQWPYLALRVPKRRVAKTLFIGSISLTLFALVSIGAIKLTMMQENIGDCGEGPPVSKPYPGQTVFIARVIHFDPYLGSVAVVKDRFWGLSRFNKVVFLKALGKPGDVYFVAGYPSDGLLTRHVFPVINMHCSRSTLVQYATADLRVLREGPKPGVRIIGRTTAQHRGEALPHIRVIVDGPRGKLVTTSDQDGIYDVSGLPSGQYSVYVDDDREGYRPRSSCPYSSLELKSGDVGGCTLRMFEPTPTSPH